MDIRRSLSCRPFSWMWNRWIQCLPCPRRRRSTLLLVSATALLWWVLTTCVFTDKYLQFRPQVLASRETGARYFVLARDGETYMYSAIANLRPSWASEHTSDHSDNGRTEIVVTTLDKTRASFHCCVLLDDGQTLLVTPAWEYYREPIANRMTLKEHVKHYLFPEYYLARQLACTVPGSDSPKFVTLTSSSSCSPDVTDYLPVIFPPRVPGGLALCGKIAHSGGLDPEKVIEWFEMQQILGVDKILLYDMGNPPALNRVFRYYQKLGVLDLQPYELPGFPKNRSLSEKWKRTRQFRQDETVAVLECRQRMSGYDYVISHDVDEFIIPRQDIDLKSLIQQQLAKFPQAAGFYFFTAFFIITWSPTNPEEDLMVTRYRKTRVPRWEAYKYVYLPERVITSITHSFFPKGSLKGETVPVEEAYLHHYRACPRDTWGTCSVQTLIDDTMTRYHDLEARVVKVRQATLTSPQWTPERSKKRPLVK